MIEFIPYRADHLADLIAQGVPHLRFSDAMRTDVYAKSLDVAGRAWTGIIDGKVVGCGGFVPVWAGRSICWAFFGKFPQREWSRVVRRIRVTLDTEHGMGVRRIEAYVHRNHGNGCRLADILGFKIEGLMQAFTTEGDAFMYARVR